MEIKLNNEYYKAGDNNHSGWSSSEDKMLFEEAKTARTKNEPLRLVFDRMAKKTGRKPNSIRNYYYMRIRDEDIASEYADVIGQTATFTPFEEDEVRTLVKNILSKQAVGVSVRAATMQLADGDTTAMLRYQNKYRAVLKSEPQLINEICQELEADGLPSFNPYISNAEKKVGRPRKTNSEPFTDLFSETLTGLDRIDGLNVTSLFENLGALALNAVKGAEAIRRLNIIEGNENTVAEEELSELKQIVIDQNSEISKYTEELERKEYLLSKLIRINKNFLDMTGVAKVSMLGNYVKDLTQIISLCNESAI